MIRLYQNFMKQVFPVGISSPSVRGFGLNGDNELKGDGKGYGYSLNYGHKSGSGYGFPPIFRSRISQVYIDFSSPLYQEGKLNGSGYGYETIDRNSSRHI